MSRTPHALGAALLLAALVLATWPLAANPFTAVLGTPGLEGVDHLWSLYAALHDGPLIINTGLVKHPEGYTWVLADPLNLLWFALPALLVSPTFGFHVVQVANLLLAAVAAVLLGRELLPSDQQQPWLTAAAVVTAAPLCAGLFTGMTEAQTWGWAGLALVAVHRAARLGGLRPVLLAGVLAGLTAWAGIYTALYATFAALPVVISGLYRGGPGWPRRMGALLGSGLLASLLAAPVAWAITNFRGEDLPGSSSLTEAVFMDPGLPQNRMLGADLAGIFLPLPSAVGTELHAVYCGGFVVLLALLGLARRRTSLGLLAAVVVLFSLGLGLFLQVGGEVILTADGRPLVTPAGWLSLWFEPLGRAPRWYRAVAVGLLFMAPLAGSGAARLLAWLPRRLAPLGLVVLVALVVADNTWLSPLHWPRDTFSALPPDGYDQLDGDGPIVEIPSVRFASIVPGRPATASGGGMRRPEDPVRHPSLLWQTTHHHPLGGNPHQAERTRTNRDTSKAVDRLMDGAVDEKQGRVEQGLRSLGKLGFTWLVHHPTAHSSAKTEALVRALGEPEIKEERLYAWRVPAVESEDLDQEPGGAQGEEP